jgi:hypothetical protein
MSALISRLVTKRGGRIKHRVDRFGLWEETRYLPPRNEYGPLVNLGILQLYWWGEWERCRRFIKSASREELATFITLLAAIGELDVMPRRAEVMQKRTDTGPFDTPDTSIALVSPPRERTPE